MGDKLTIDENDYYDNVRIKAEKLSSFLRLKFLQSDEKKIGGNIPVKTNI